MARRRRHFGLVKRSGKKIAARFWKNYHADRKEPPKVVHVRVLIERGTTPTNTGRRAGYWATACVGSIEARGGRRKIRGGAHGYKKCSTDVLGRTPTLAMKKALVALGRDEKVR